MSYSIDGAWHVARGSLYTDLEVSLTHIGIGLSLYWDRYGAGLKASIGPLHIWLGYSHSLEVP